MSILPLSCPYTLRRTFENLKWLKVKTISGNVVQYKIINTVFYLRATVIQLFKKYEQSCSPDDFYLFQILSG